MVAVIHTSKSLRTVLNYNENKVNEGVAECLFAGNYPKDAADLGFNQKLRRLADQAALRPSVKVNSVHISLNFDPSEALSATQLTEIASAYLDKIGFAGQPFLVYRHDDAAHPHIHILTTSIRPDGSPIKLHNLGKSQSETARKELEMAYGLVRAEDQTGQKNPVKSAYTARAEYGKSETRRAIANVLSGVLNVYRYGSLAELNAVLGLYNVEATRGGEGSRIYRTNGLVYRVLDAGKNPVGVPIKASLLPGKPLLKSLETRFGFNKKFRNKYRNRVKNAVELALLKPSADGVQGLVHALQKQGIDVVLRINGAGELYGVTYVDHETKCVFNGGDLGKGYSANALRKRCGDTGSADSPAKLKQIVRSEIAKAERANQSLPGPVNDRPPVGSSEYLLDILLQPEYSNEHLPWELRNRLKRKKKRKQSNDNP